MLEERQRSMRVLIVEDEVLIALHLADMLSDLGHEVVQSAHHLAEAIRLAEVAVIDLAILDLNLGGMRSDPVAGILRRRGIPFIFATGYGASGLPAGFEDELILGKPYGEEELRRVLARLIARMQG